ncbi:selenocysteine insertion sequence-binding protein 2 [Drosophila kikkawai]|uniref:Selenocysteine insertion sequence-binding protein 2 n=1 Tax=Drosophila kikkawai TaxID=30033 RepID=A0A6P4HS98_DROKI|nr:selenocysteine insertion sequence-binding protein 2 [Drosophila kikkawai]
MSRNSEKINLIDERTYKKLQEKDNGAKITPRSAKYKNQHRKAEQQPTLLDFVVKPRQTQRQIKARKLRKRPHLTITRCSYVAPKAKGKTRLVPKKKVTRLKKSIRRFRTLKRADGETEEIPQEDHSEEYPSVELQLQKLSLDEITKEASVEPKKVHSIHSRRFRSYCDNCTRPRLKQLAIQLLKDLDRFQKRAFAKNEIKARAHPRLVLGIREALARLRIRKVRLLLMATDCEICPGESGLDETIENLKELCQQQRVPYCFPLARRELSYALQKRAQISCVAVLDYDGAQEVYSDLLGELEAAREEYKRLTAVS